nr:transposase [Methylobacterium durans]
MRIGRPRPPARRPRLQARLRPPARERARPDEPAHRLAAGEHAGSARPHPARAGAVDLYCASYPVPPDAVTLDIDDTCDVVHGQQQLSLFNAHHDGAAFCRSTSTTPHQPPVAMILRPGKTPSGREVRGHLRRLVRAIRRHWPNTAITIRGDGHYGRPEAMDWCEDNRVAYVFG